MSAATLISLTGCRVGPDYQRPVVDVPGDYHWKNPIAAALAPAASAPDWLVFKDPKLDELEALALAANQDIKVAVARVDEARAATRVSRADLFPQISIQPNFRRADNSAHTFYPGISSFLGKTGGQIPGIRTPFNDFQLPLDVSYEADVWGRVRRSIEGARDRAEASVADYHSVLLTVAGDVAANYFLVRSLDAQIDVLKHSIDLRKESLDLVNKKFNMGVTDELDVNRAKTEQSTAEASLAETKRQREQAINVLAILCGRTASDFSLEFTPLVGTPPEIPTGLPSELLERRPDVVSAERLLAAANEDIGVAKAAFFPRLSLTASGGFESQDLQSLFTPTSAIFNFVANAVQPVFSGGRNKAQLEAAKARYQQALAQYRQQILVAFKEVEDALVDLRYRAEQAKAIDDAVESSRKVTKLAQLRYDNGRVGYLDVVDAEREQLAVEQQAADLLGQRMAATVRLIKALGGGWPACPSRCTGPAEFVDAPSAASDVKPPEKTVLNEVPKPQIAEKKTE